MSHRRRSWLLLLRPFLGGDLTYRSPLEYDTWYILETVLWECSWVNLVIYVFQKNTSQRQTINVTIRKISKGKIHKPTPVDCVDARNLFTYSFLQATFKYILVRQECPLDRDVWSMDNKYPPHVDECAGQLQIQFVIFPACFLDHSAIKTE